MIVGGRGGDLGGHLVDAGQAEGGLGQIGVGGEPVVDGCDGNKQGPPPMGMGLNK